MEIDQKEENGIVCIAIKGRMGSELSPKFEKVLIEIFEGNCFRDTVAIAASVESGIQTLQSTFNPA